MTGKQQTRQYLQYHKTPQITKSASWPATSILRDWSSALREQRQQGASLHAVHRARTPGVPDLLCEGAETPGSAEDKRKATLRVRKRSGLGAINNNKDK